MEDWQLMDKLYIKDPKTDSLYSLIYNGFDCDDSSESGFDETFEDEEFTISQCKEGANRSFEDLLAVSRAYFPETTPKQLKDVLYTLNNEKALTNLYCSNIGKWVFLHADTNEDWKGEIDNNNWTFEADDSDYYEEKGKGEYTMKEIAEL